MDKRRKKEEAVNDPCQLPPFHRSWKENIKFVLYIPHFASVAKQTWHQELLKEGKSSSHLVAPLTSSP
ncbi:hypothetical protein POPTR_010G084201v4 [Populus trichocarpa]|uniref:Uncharacterized protein n=1 Tax=Populus trichocarpa TaxID=3694 RepID=A0ACC0SCB0_POPTR|nr:hypothetical protein POPTR_010G084201v4 [Populus trichocarpa]